MIFTLHDSLYNCFHYSGYKYSLDVHDRSCFATFCHCYLPHERVTKVLLMRVIGLNGTQEQRRYLSALLLNNGLPSFVLGTSSALLVCCLSVAGIFERGYCVPAGAVGYYATLLLWRRKKLVFLDVACICQTDATLKAEGLISMGAFLKSSKFLVVLWDTTYVSRLWCMPLGYVWCHVLHVPKGPRNLGK